MQPLRGCPGTYSPYVPAERLRYSPYVPAVRLRPNASCRQSRTQRIGRRMAALGRRLCIHDPLPRSSTSPPNTVQVTGLEVRARRAQTAKGGHRGVMFERRHRTAPRSQRHVRRNAKGRQTPERITGTARVSEISDLASSPCRNGRLYLYGRRTKEPCRAIAEDHISAFAMQAPKTVNSAEIVERSIPQRIWSWWAIGLRSIDFSYTSMRIQ
jgi:hypothetical protein